MPKSPLSPFLLPATHAGDAQVADTPPRPRATMSLDASELLVIAALRAWVAPVVRPGEAHPDWHEIFALARLPPTTMLAFHTLMGILGTQSRRLIAVPCCGCPGVGKDETAAIRLVAALQRQDLLPALDILGDWLAPEAVGPALRAARRLAIGMVTAGLVLPGAAAPQSAAILH